MILAGKNGRGVGCPPLWARAWLRLGGAAVMVGLLAMGAAAATLEDMQLLNAASTCSIDEMVDLLDRGASVEARSTGGHTPLLMAAFGDCPAAVEILLDLGADESARDASGNSALDLARQYGYGEIAELLGGEIDEDLPEEGTGSDEGREDPAGADAGLDAVAPPGGQQTPIADGPGMCKDMYLSCQASCGYFIGTQWHLDYSCTAQCAACNEACEAGRPVACTDGFRPWGGQ